MTPQEALDAIKSDAEMQWELVNFEVNPNHGSRPTEENFWSPNVESGRKVRESSSYFPWDQPNWMSYSSEPLIRWEDSI